MRVIFPSLSYCEAIGKAEIPTLSERRESLSIELFKDIVSNEHHKLATFYGQFTRSASEK